MHDKQASSSHIIAWSAVFVAALGYFVDVFDLWLFANFRVPSLNELGITGADNTRQGAYLLNCQQVGLLVGGFLWGILGDRAGRAKVMFASILTYSLANLANGFVTTIESYAILRLIAGLGLAGEIGAGVTLVSELLPKEKRGYGVTIVATIGVAGAVGAALVGSYLHWRTGYIVGGVMGLLLLFMRMLVHESGIYQQLEGQTEVRRGSLKLLFGSRERVARFLACITIGIPLWVVFGLYGVFAPELAVALNISEPIKVPTALLYASVGITIGDLVSGLMSQRLKSRKIPIFVFLSAGLVLSLILGSGVVTSASAFYAIIGAMGFFVGYWICLIATTAEQFGTNLRATVTTSVPNLVRATVIPISASFVALKETQSASNAALYIALVAYVLAFWGLWKIRESFARDLNFVEK